jgi:hypothetical protein
MMYATAGIDDEKEKLICPSRFFSIILSL